MMTKLIISYIVLAKGLDKWSAHYFLFISYVEHTDIYKYRVWISEFPMYVELK